MPYLSRAYAITYELTKDGDLVTPELRECHKDEWLRMGMLGPPGGMGYAFRVDLWAVDANGEPICAIPFPGGGVDQTMWRLEFFINADDGAIEKIPGWVGIPPKRIIELPSY
jgi:hypothetical protein